MNNIISVAIPTPLYQLFDYICDQPISPGQRVLVPFGRQKLVGFVWKTSNTSTFDIKKLKRVITILDDKPLLDAALMKLLQWASDYYHHPIGNVCATALPNLLKQAKPAEFKSTVYWQVNPNLGADDEKRLAKAKKQLALFNFLKSKDTPVSDSDVKAEGFTSATTKALLEKNIIEKAARVEPAIQVTPSTIELNQEQAQAIEAVTSKLNTFQPFLLEGVTASGKTEVYLQAIEKVIQNNQQALVLVPEIGLTPQTIQRFKNRFGDICETMHSGMTDRERLNTWLLAKDNKAKIIIGTRSAIFTPFKSLGIIIIDEEHDLSFKQQEGLRYSARDVAIIRARFEDIPVVLGSATPSLESLHNCEKKNYIHLALPERASSKTTCKFHTIDIRHQFLENGLSKALIGAIKRHINNNHQVLLFLNRRGFAPVLICHECGHTFKCQRCDIHLTYHYKKHQLACHHCERVINQPNQCPDCKSAELTPIGVGTERLESALAAHFPKTKILRIDRDTTRRKNELNKLLDDIHSGEAQILIGTQMLAKGHHFPKLSMVGIVNIDQGFFSSDFRAIERTGQLIMQVAGRAGRELSTGEVFLQTHQPDHPLLTTLLEKNYHAFAKQLLAERQQCALPPFSYFSLIRAESHKEHQPMSFLHEVKRLLNSNDITALGPIPAIMPKRAGKYRAQLLLTSQQRKLLHTLLRDLITKVNSSKLANQVRWSLDIDPQDMF